MDMLSIIPAAAVILAGLVITKLWKARYGVVMTLAGFALLGAVGFGYSLGFSEAARQAGGIEVDGVAPVALYTLREALHAIRLPDWFGMLAFLLFAGSTAGALVQAFGEASRHDGDDAGCGHDGGSEE